MKRKVLLRLGGRGDQVVVREDRAQGYYVVHFRTADGIEKKRKFALERDGKREALRFAEGWHAERSRRAASSVAAASPTMREMWTAFQSHEFGDLRAATIISYRHHWQRWEVFVGVDRNPETITLADVAAFKAEAARQGIATNQIRQTLAVVKTVFMWAHRHELIERNRMALHRWKQAKDAVVAEPAEYTEAEYEALLRELGGGQRHDRWRAWAVIAIAGEHGQRARAVLHLRWSDVDWSAGEIVWCAEYQKQGKELRRPITAALRAALETCWYWREWALAGKNRRRNRERLAASLPERVAEADWVIFARNNKTKPAAYSGVHQTLQRAESRAGVPHLGLRAFHGLRKMVVTRIVAATGDRMLGLEFVGDTDPKMLKRYDKGLGARIRAAAQALETATGTSHDPKKERETSPKRPGDENEKSAPESPERQAEEPQPLITIRS